MVLLQQGASSEPFTASANIPKNIGKDCDISECFGMLKA